MKQGLYIFSAGFRLILICQEKMLDTTRELLYDDTGDKK